MSGKKDEPKKQEDDELFDFIYKYLLLSRKVKADAWAKLLGSEDLKDIILKFFNVPSNMILTIQLTSAGALMPFLGIESPSRVKSSYFIKREPIKITKYNYREMLILGDMAPKPIEETTVLMEEVYLPILMNPINHTGWPLIAEKDVKKHVYDLRSLLYQIKGKMFGETILPMPIDIEKIFEEEWKLQQNDDAQFNIKLRSNIESIIIKWTSQVNEILDEEGILLSSDYLLPNDELDFWFKRIKNLESIYQQIKDPRVKKMGSILELTESSYSENFKTIWKNVIAAIIEARDIWMHLKPLEYYLNKIQSTEFKDIQPLLKPLMHCICLIWSNSKYYSTTTRIIRLLSMVSNLLISEANKFLDQSSLFEGDAEDNLKRLEQTKNIIIYHQDIFQIFRDKVDTYFKSPNEPILWNFHDKLIFGRLRKFDERLKELQVEIMDRKLVNIFSQAFMECYDIESMFRFIWIMGTIANRPILIEQLWHNYNRLIEIINAEYDNIKVIIDNYFYTNTKLENNIAREKLYSVPEALAVLNNMKKQIDYPIECASLVDHPLIVSRINLDIRDKYDELQNGQKKLQKDVKNIY